MNQFLMDSTGWSHHIHISVDQFGTLAVREVINILYGIDMFFWQWHNNTII